MGAPPQNRKEIRVPAAFREQVGKGRPKGAKNKSTRLAKDAIALAAEGLGGAEGLLTWAKADSENQRIFWQSIYTKLIPVQVTGEDGGPLRAAVEVIYRTPNAG